MSFDPRLGKNVFHNMPMNVGEAEITTLVAIGKTFVIDAEKMEDGGVEVVHVHGAGRPLVLGRLGPQRVAICIGDIVAIIISAPVGDTRLDPTSGHPSGETARVMIASIVLFGQLALAVGGSTELAPPDDQRVLE